MTRKKVIKLTSDTLKTDYDKIKPQVEKFMAALCEQIGSILLTQGITLGVPLECRIKLYESISDKIERKEISLKSVVDLDDLVGIRLILLFKRDLEKIHKTITDTLNVISYEDAGSRLPETQFGYQSVHYIVKLPKTWLKIPSLKEFGDFKAEIQVRTLAQHIWAASSHVLQYKQESSVPQPIRRSIYRVSAILETVDLEFERVLSERETYISKVGIYQDDTVLNVDLVRRVLDELLPADHKIVSEPYGLLVEELLIYGINTIGKLKRIIKSHLKTIIENEKRIIQLKLKTKNYTDYDLERLKRGVFFTYVGLIRRIMNAEKWKDHNNKPREKR